MAVFTAADSAMVFITAIASGFETRGFESKWGQVSDPSSEQVKDPLLLLIRPT